jgi:hypothetical protein
MKHHAIFLERRLTLVSIYLVCQVFEGAAKRTEVGVEEHASTLAVFSAGQKRGEVALASSRAHVQETFCALKFCSNPELQLSGCLVALSFPAGATTLSSVDAITLTCGL